MLKHIQVKGHTFVEGQPQYATGFVLHVHLKAWSTPAALNMADLLTADGTIVHRAFVLQADLLGVLVEGLPNCTDQLLWRIADVIGGAQGDFALAVLAYREAEELRFRETTARAIRAESRRNGARLLANR
jgi:hypothetical protein